VHLAIETIDSTKPSTFRSFSLDITCWHFGTQESFSYVS
jgi:hypothetical protein